MIRFLIELFSVAALATLAHAVVRTWGEPTADAKRERARDRVMREADDDDHRCYQCGRVCAERRLVLLHDDAALCCEACAALLKYTNRRVA